MTILYHICVILTGNNFISFARMETSVAGSQEKVPICETKSWRASQKKIIKKYFHREQMRIARESKKLLYSFCIENIAIK